MALCYGQLRRSYSAPTLGYLQGEQGNPSTRRDQLSTLAIMFLLALTRQKQPNCKIQLKPVSILAKQENVFDFLGVYKDASLTRAADLLAYEIVLRLREAGHMKKWGWTTIKRRLVKEMLKTSSRSCTKVWKPES